MAITYSLAPEPFWIIINNEGTVAGGAKMYTRSSLNFEQPKIVYQDAGGTIPWTNPIIFDLNGVQGPFYWEFNSAMPDDLYYIFVNDADGNLLWDITDFSPGTNGGGGNVTTYLPLTNYIANNVFINHVDDTTTTALTNLVVAPSNHKGFTPALITPILATPYGVVGPDIRFVKNTTANTDSISFELFPLASSPFDPDITPVEYLRYNCTTSIAGETYKYFQFPVTQKIKNLSNTIMTFQVWARVATAPVTLTAYVFQYFGSGTAASAPVQDTIDTLSLTTTWTHFSFSFTVPDVAGKSIGTLGQQTDDDALYIQLQMPLSTACDVYFTKPALYLGDIDPDQNFENYDQIDSINSTARTGDIKTSLLSSAPFGWVAMDDRSIGNVGSGATNRANKDTFQLYKTIWDGVLDAWAPVSTGRGATAVADFIAGKTLTLPRSLGRALAGAGTGSGLTARPLGEYVGAEVVTIDAMPAHNHPGSTIAIQTLSNYSTGAASPVKAPGGATAISVATQGGGTLNVQGGIDGNMQPTSFFNVFIKL